ncbi:hypothetical protein GGR56DRAFT_644991 [Xylariaceae sp. FL0804]|nr:hypothetical protein GGR56DRAFT_644991 [Xylariaceae sp. FL0804]
MPPQKRKRTHEPVEGPDAQPQDLRRTTRQRRVAAAAAEPSSPAEPEPEYQLRSGRPRRAGSTLDKAPAATAAAAEPQAAPRGRNSDATKYKADSSSGGVSASSGAQVLPRQTRATRHTTTTAVFAVSVAAAESAGTGSSSSTKENTAPSPRPRGPLKARKPRTAAAAGSHTSGGVLRDVQQQQRRLVEEHPLPPSASNTSITLSRSPKQLQKSKPAPKEDVFGPNANNSTTIAAIAATSSKAPAKTRRTSTAATVSNRNKGAELPPPPPPTTTTATTTTPRADRNIDKVVLGDLCFRTWYPSYYAKEVLGDVAASGGINGHNNNNNNRDSAAGHGAAKIGGGKREPPVLDRLYVCPCCFKYSRELVPWRGHVRVCEDEDRGSGVPGRKIYVHPRRGLHPDSAAGRPDGGEQQRQQQYAQVPARSGAGVGGRAADSAARNHNAVEDAVGGAQEQGEWSVWEVDGEKETVSSRHIFLLLFSPLLYFPFLFGCAWIHTACKRGPYWLAD